MSRRSSPLTVDGKALHNWDEVLTALPGRTVRHSSETLNARVIPAARDVECEIAQ